jgi:Zn-dependent peptidase ImmA (M78 family)
MKMDTSEFPLKFLLAEKAAQKIHDKYDITLPSQIRLRDIAFLEKALVIEDSVVRATASLIRVQKNATIRVSSDDQPERQRFSIAHELGHLKLNHMAGKIQKVCTKRDMMSWYKKDIETEANFFASELILPTKMLKKMCDVAEVDFGPVKKMAKKFRVSLTATAIKFVRLNPEKCALVYSENGKIAWSCRSADWQPYIDHGQPLDRRTGAYLFFHDEELDDEPIETEADAWISDSREMNDIVEHSIGSKQYGFVLSLLWIRP